MLQRTLLRQCRAVTALPRASLPTASRFNQPQTFISPSTRQHSRRWYSAEPAAEAKSEGGKTEGGESAEAVKEEDPLKKTIEEQKKEIVDLKDKYLRQVAEFRNLQERTRREITSAKDFAIQKFAKDLVESVDNFDRALSQVPAEKLAQKESNEHIADLVNLYDGLKMTETILMSTLKRHGLERFDPTGEPFNPNEHEATFMTPVKDGVEGNVFHVQQKGFKLNGRILRAAKVGVVKNS